jgi:DNA-directed RNA polymerase sigma subunit (sigma70/sigma32)
MLREMVVEEALDALEAERLHKSYTIQEIADFVGVGFESMRRIEEQALSNLKLKMLRLEN